jgi:hypothetical protein
MTASMVTQIGSVAFQRPMQGRRRRVHKVRMRRLRRTAVMVRARTKATFAWGALSVMLYLLLYIFSGDIRHVAEMTNQGDRTLFLLPVGIALLFSVVHGLFTDHFWKSVGLTAKR